MGSSAAKGPTGGCDAAVRPSPSRQFSDIQLTRHQINSLAADCAEKSIELAQRRSAGYKTKQETQAKYGW